jgi:hypothetical protein
MMKAREINELAKVVGGSVLDEVFRQYMDYLYMLYDKYGVRGLKNVKKVCTFSEREELLEMLNEVMRVSTKPELCK